MKIHAFSRSGRQAGLGIAAAAAIATLLASGDARAQFAPPQVMTPPTPFPNTPPTQIPQIQSLTPPSVPSAPKPAQAQPAPAQAQPAPARAIPAASSAQ